jgi:Family of unknown function (DUF6152)
MKKTSICRLAFALLLLPGVAMAHHGAAAHFDLTQRIEISGTVQKFERINPHAFLYVSVPNPSGPPDVWQCELNGTSYLTRIGITKDTFRPGDQIRIEANPARRDAHGCLFLEAHLSDGRTISAQPDTGNAPPSPVDTANNSIFGVWYPGRPAAPRPAGAAGPPPNPLLFLTDAGKQAHAGYDPIRDDPTRKCSPVGPIHLWHEPSYPFELVKEKDRVVLHYEFMDAVRDFYLDAPANPTKVKRTILGHSVAHFEGDTLVIDTTDFLPGVLMQYGQDGAGKTAGILHSDAYHVTERVAVNPETHQLEVSLVQEDPKYFTRTFAQNGMTFNRRPDLTIGKFNCVVDKDLNH